MKSLKILLLVSISSIALADRCPKKLVLNCVGQGIFKFESNTPSHVAFTNPSQKLDFYDGTHNIINENMSYDSRIRCEGAELRITTVISDILTGDQKLSVIFSYNHGNYPNLIAQKNTRTKSKTVINTTCSIIEKII